MPRLGLGELLRAWPAAINCSWRRRAKGIDYLKLMLVEDELQPGAGGSGDPGQNPITALSAILDDEARGLVPGHASRPSRWPIAA